MGKENVVLSARGSAAQNNNNDKGLDRAEKLPARRELLEHFLWLAFFVDVLLTVFIAHFGLSFLRSWKCS